MREHRNLVLGALGLGVVVIALVFVFFVRGSEPEPEALPAATHSAITTEPEVEEDEPTSVIGSTSGLRSVQATSNRDPFEPVVKPTEQANDTSKSSSEKTSSSTTKKQKPTTKQADVIQKSKSPNAKGEPTTETKSKTTKSDKPKDSGDAAPKPIGGGGSVDEPGQTTEVSVVAIRLSTAVVRVNNTRTTLYLNVPDSSGVTYVSSLGGGCGWFTLAGTEDRLTICEGETRSL